MGPRSAAPPVVHVFSVEASGLPAIVFSCGGRVAAAQRSGASERASGHPRTLAPAVAAYAHLRPADEPQHATGGRAAGARSARWRTRNHAAVVRTRSARPHSLPPSTLRQTCPLSMCLEARPRARCAAATCNVGRGRHWQRAIHRIVFPHATRIRGAACHLRRAEIDSGGRRRRLGVQTRSSAVCCPRA